MVAARLVTGQARARNDETARFGLAALTVAGVAIALTARTIGFALVFDDRSLLGPEGPLALGNGVLPYRPVRYLSYLVDSIVGGGAPWAYHATNVALHAIAGVLVTRIARRLGASSVAALAAGLLFVTHPLGVEAVAYVAGRRDLLVTVLGSAALLAWTSSAGRSAAALVLLMLAIGAKESGVFYLGTLVLASAAGLGPSLGTSRTALAATALAGIALPIAYGASGPLAPAGPPCATVAAVTSIASHYALHVVAPLSLAVEYPALARASSDCAELATASALAGFALLGAAAGIVLAALRNGFGGARLAWAWAALYFLLLATVIGSHEPGADRHAYPLIGFVAIGLTTCGERVLARLGAFQHRARVAIACVVLAVVATLAVLSVRRASIWRDERALWSATVVDAPGSGRAEHNLAGVLLAAGELDAAALHVRRARELGYPPALLGDAAVACARGRVHRGRDLLARARMLGTPADEVERVAAGCEAKASAALVEK